MTCPTCGASLLLQASQSNCMQCGHQFQMRTIVDKIVVDHDIPEPTQEDTRRDLQAALEHARDFHKSEGRALTWEMTPTGADCFLDGEYAWDARIEHKAGWVREGIYITHNGRRPQWTNEETH